ncbi:hypothetical protein [Desulforapulum autotrophicum]|uniref:hypothetical protein n=1 Tax=Desulforapulum autotrophicum TaxID=2296 RepID=UPI0003193547|nr:hypothetical protein [Desulforapulum autotrophicum]
MNSTDQHEKNTRLKLLSGDLDQIRQANDPKQIRRHLGLIQLRCLDFRAWLDRVEDAGTTDRRRV